ncbi:MAG: hypothetical protein RIR00_525 [Pseudomonadota bacterium]|jgi:16S rRNA (guanine527-N7)-methyltransferase
MSRERLEAGLAGMSLQVSAEAVDKLLAYRDLLVKWNRTYNLTSLRDPEQMLSLHLLDSLAIRPMVGQGPLLDVGSGAGLPGIPLAIICPELEVTSVDTVQKKVSFQQQVAIELGLRNLRPVHARVEEMQGRFPRITSRAFSELAQFVALTRHLLAPGGEWLAMKGQFPEDELAALPADIQVPVIEGLRVPGVDAERCVVIMRVI